MSAAPATRAEFGERWAAATAVSASGLREGMGVAWRRDRLAWRIAGADASAYLHRMLTQDVLGLPVPGGARACLLDRRGRVLGDFRLWRFEDEIVLDGDAACAPAREVLERYVIADDVVLEDWSDTRVRLVCGGPRPRLASVLGSLVGGAIGEVRREEGIAAQWVRCGTGEACEVLAEPARAWLAVEAWLAADGGNLADEIALANWQVRLGEPRMGHELGSERLFNEAHLEDAVSWTKGCYPGQEPVAMAKYRGKPPASLVRLRELLEADGSGSRAPLESGAELLLDGKRAGQVTSLERGGERASGRFALAYVSPFELVAAHLPEGAAAPVFSTASGARLGALGWAGTSRAS